jgi:hypothetical protein
MSNEVFDISTAKGAELVDYAKANGINIRDLTRVSDIRKAITDALNEDAKDVVVEDKVVLSKAEYDALVNNKTEGRPAVVAQVVLGKTVLMEYTEKMHGPDFVEKAKAKAHARNLEVVIK